MADQKLPRFASHSRNDWQKAVEKIKRLALDGDVKMLTLWADRICPAYRTVDIATEVPGLHEAQSLTEKTDAVFASVSQGRLSVKDGQALAMALASAAKVSEVDDLRKRVEAIEGRPRAA